MKTRRNNTAAGRKRSLRRKLAGALSLALAIASAGSIYAIIQMDRIGDEIHEVTAIGLPLVTGMTAIEEQIYERHIALEKLFGAKSRSTDEERGQWRDAAARLEGSVRSVRNKVAKEIQVAGTDASGVNEWKAVATSLEELGRATDEHQALVGEFVRAVEDGRDDQRAKALPALLEEGAGALDATAHDILADLEAKTLEAASRSEAHEVSAMKITLALTIVAVLAGFAAVAWVVRGLTAPLKGLTERAEAISRGEIGTEPLGFETGDEINVLGDAFDAMSEQLVMQIGDTTTTVEALAAASNQILAAAREQAAATRQQAATIQEITASLEEIAQSGTQISEQAGDVARRAEESSDASESGREAISHTSRTMGSIRDQIEELAENIVSLSEKTQAVGDIIAVVNEIAEQSNLLALNAAIEAAAAGDQGARFSVVANEIKNLADQAKDSTGQIRQILGEIQKGIHGAVMLTEEAVKRADAGRSSTETSERTVADLLVAARESVDAFQQIIAGSNQQQIGIGQITQGMQDIRLAAEQAAVSTGQLESAASDLTNMSGKLSGVVDRYTVVGN